MVMGKLRERKFDVDDIVEFNDLAKLLNEKISAQCSSAEKKETEVKEEVKKVEKVEEVKEEKTAEVETKNEDMSAKSRSMDFSAGGMEEKIVEQINAKLQEQIVPMFFGPYKTIIGEEMFRKKLNEHFDIIKAVVNNVPLGYVIQVTGHANRPPGMSDVACKSLSLKRANKVYNALIKKGLDSSKLKAKGIGNAEPYAEGVTRDQKEEWKKNRRVTFKVVKK